MGQQLSSTNAVDFKQRDYHIDEFRMAWASFVSLQVSLSGHNLVPKTDLLESKFLKKLLGPSSISHCFDIPGNHYVTKEQFIWTLCNDVYKGNSVQQKIETLMEMYGLTYSHHHHSSTNKIISQYDYRCLIEYASKFGNCPSSLGSAYDSIVKHDNSLYMDYSMFINYLNTHPKDKSYIFQIIKPTQVVVPSSSSSSLESSTIISSMDFVIDSSDDDESDVEEEDIIERSSSQVRLDFSPEKTKKKRSSSPSRLLRKSSVKNQSPFVTQDFICGYLYKVGDGKWSRNSWHTRWFILDKANAVLHYYKYDPSSSSSSSSVIEEENTNTLPPRIATAVFKDHMKIDTKHPKYRGCFEFTTTSSLLFESRWAKHAPTRYYFQTFNNSSSSTTSGPKMFKLCTDNEDVFVQWTTQIAESIIQKGNDTSNIRRRLSSKRRSAVSSCTEEVNEYKAEEEGDDHFDRIALVLVLAIISSLWLFISDTYYSTTLIVLILSTILVLVLQRKNTTRLTTNHKTMIVGMLFILLSVIPIVVSVLNGNSSCSSITIICGTCPIGFLLYCIKKLLKKEVMLPPPTISDSVEVVKESITSSNTTTTTTFDMNSTTSSSYSKISAQTFNVRSESYQENKRKEPSSDALFTFRGVDVISSTSKIDEVHQYIDFPEESDTKYFVLNAQLPNYAPPNPVWGSAIDDGPGYSIVLYWSYRSSTLLDSSSPEVKLLQRFLAEDDDIMIHDRFKVIAKVDSPESLVTVKGPTKKLMIGYNATPVLTRPQHRIYVDDKVTEVDVDVHQFCYFARKALYNLLDTTSEMVIDVAFLLQGNDVGELPERVLGAGRVCKINLKEAMTLEEALQNSKKVASE